MSQSQLSQTCHEVSQSQLHDNMVMMEGHKRFQNNNVIQHILYMVIQDRLKQQSTDYQPLVYKIDILYLEAPLSSLVINSIQGFTFDHNTYVLSHNMNSFSLKVYNNLCDFFKWYAINMETNFPRGCITSLSPNNSKGISVNNRESKSSSLSYTTLKYQILQVWGLQSSLYICSRNEL